MSQEWREEKAQVSEIKENMTCGMKAVINSAVEWDEYVDRGMDKFQERLNRHRVEINKSYCREKELMERVEELEAQVESMSNKLCHCGQESPAFEGDGGLEYADSPGEYHTPPNTSLLLRRTRHPFLSLIGPKAFPTLQIRKMFLLPMHWW
jgi:hypothetical protein